MTSSCPEAEASR